MTDPIYRTLARVLDSIPPGFPGTESGIELKLLARIYTPEEAILVAAMRLTYESADDIAARAGTDPAAALTTLTRASDKGLVRTQAGEHEPLFALNPQVAGVAGLDIRALRADAEVAALSERYVLESRGRA